jgi:serine/threonine protein kinase/ActR/RegA family two-component response regulator
LSAFDVLVVDDEQDIRTYLQTILQEEGLTVRCVPNATEALALIKQEKPQLIILDLMMPEMPGDELCRIIKGDSALKDIVVFILTSKGDLETKLACFSSGAEEYLVKPIDSRELTARVGRFIRLIDELKMPTALPSSEVISKTKIAVDGATSPPKSDPDVPSLALSDYSFLNFQSSYGVYRVESLVGKGGMGQVFKAHDEQLDRYVAVKVLAAKLSRSPEFVERFRREAKVLASINHPGIASIYSFSEQKGEHYFAMQWCSGGSVSDLVRKKGRVEPMTGVDIIYQCAQALNAASKKGIVHRDIKPSNLMFDENQLIKIVDFGLAYAEQISTNLTQGGEFLGTPSYMAPEQAKSPSVDHRADIYSLGITFYHMLYSKLPFQATSPIEMVIKHTSHPFPEYDSLDGKLPKSVYRIIEKMTQKEPAKRYQDYGALIQDLEGVRNEFLHRSQLKIPSASRVAPVSSITSGNFFELLALVHSRLQSGLITCKWNTLEKRFLVKNSDIVLFDSVQPDENIWLYLAKKGVMKREDIPLNKNEIEQPLNRLLLNHAFTLEDFKRAYRELMISALHQVHFWPVFEGHFATAQIEHEAFCSIPMVDYLLNAARETIDYALIKAQVPNGVTMRRTEQFDYLLRTLNLNPEESFVASRFEGENVTVDMLNLLTGLPEERITRIIFSLAKFGAIEFKAPEKPSASTRKSESFAKVDPVPVPVYSPPPAPPKSARIETVQPVPTPQPTPIAQPVAAPVVAAPVQAAPAAIKVANPSVTTTPPPTAQAVKPKTATRPKEIGPDPKTEAALRDNYLLEMQRRRFTAIPNEDTPTPTPTEAQVRMEVQKSAGMIEAEQHIKVAEQFFKLAEKKFEDGDFYNVTSLCKQAIQNHPTDPRYYQLMAQAYSKHPRFLKDAQANWEKAIELDPWNPEFHVQLAEFYIQQGLWLRASNHVKKALTITPEHKRATELTQTLKGKHR